MEQASHAYAAFSTSWIAKYNEVLNSDAAAADADPKNVTQYARTIAEAYEAFGLGIRAIAFPPSIQAAVRQELEAVDVLVSLARQLESDSSNVIVRTQLQDALGRVGQTSGAVETALGVRH